MNISYYYKCNVPQWLVSNWDFGMYSIADMKRTERNRIEFIINALKKPSSTDAKPVTA